MPSANPYKTAVSRRPSCAAEVAGWSHDLREYGYHFSDWLHELEKVHAKAEFFRRIAQAPVPMAGRFPEGDVADASLAAEIEHLCRENGILCPAWVLLTPPAEKPWFPGDADAYDRAEGYQLAPSSFRSRNVFYRPYFKPTFRAGRPAGSRESLRAKSAERSRRYRQKLLLDAGRKKSENRR